MGKNLDVQIGQVKTGSGKVILQSNAIGSCVAIAGYDAAKNIGALAHVMLPGKAPEDEKPGKKNRYAADAIDTILSKMALLGSQKDDIEAFLVGGANVLNRKDDTICEDNIKSAMELLSEKGLKVKAKAVGGNCRRNVTFDVECGIIYYSEGDSSQVKLWSAEQTRK